MLWTHRAPSIAGFTDGAMILAGTPGLLNWSAPGAGRDARPDVLRGLMLETCFAVARTARDSDPPAIVQDGEASLRLTTDQGEKTVRGSILMRTPVILADGLSSTRQELSTQTLLTSDAAGWPIAIAVAVVVAGGLGVAAVLVSDKVSEVIDRKLARDADLQKLAMVHAQTLALVRRHQDREDAAGKSLPLDPATGAALNALAKDQDAIVSRGGPEPRSRGVLEKMFSAEAVPFWVLGGVALGAYALNNRKGVRSWLEAS